MEKLREKTFYTIFIIISLFVILSILILNIKIYNDEYSNIKNNLIKMTYFVNGERPNKKNAQEKEELDNKIIMDYNFYTILLDKNNNIIDKISHNENSFNTKIMNEILNIISNKESEIKIRCLYLNNISYNYSVGNYLIIADTTNINEKLISILFVSLLILVIFEIITYYVSKKITDWITKPVEESFKNQKEFIANASHELKTPLSVIMASIDCLSVNKKNEKYINNLKSESDRMNDLITRLLDLSKSENKLSVSNFSVNDISKIVEKRALIFESLAYEKTLEIETNIEKDVLLKCNPNDIDELISIIIDNAIKHSYKNSKILVNLYRNKNNIIIDIINSGDDIPKEDYNKIFERFYRSDKSRNRNSNRYGLGLAIAKNIVLNHSGEIKAFSQNNKTTFRIIFK